MRNEGWVSRWKQLRGPASFALGATILIFDAISVFAHRPIDPTILLIVAGLLGLPMFEPRSRK